MSRAEENDVRLFRSDVCTYEGLRWVMVLDSILLDGIGWTCDASTGL